MTFSFSTTTTPNNLSMIVPNFKVLVADDAGATRKVIRIFLESQNVQVIEAKNGQEAYDYFCQTLPDVILLDVLMPIMGGFEAAELIRKHPHGKTIPIVFLSVDSDKFNRLTGLSVGTDYIIKPMDLDVLSAKLRQYALTAQLQRELIQVNQALLSAQQVLEQEQDITEDLINHMLKQYMHNEPCLQRWTTPSLRFNGDLILSARGPDDSLYVIVGDATGHGLAAAINVLPICSIFDSMAKQGLSLKEIAQELNTQLRRLLPIGRFVAATIAKINLNQRQIEVWNGGNPALQVLDEHGKVIQSVPSHAAALGVLSTEEFNDGTIHHALPHQASVLIVTDGFVERFISAKITYFANQPYLKDWSSDSDIHIYMEDKLVQEQQAGEVDDATIAIIRI
jgi:CheY-like chemotaxis protein